VTGAQFYFSNGCYIASWNKIPGTRYSVQLYNDSGQIVHIQRSLEINQYIKCFVPNISCVKIKATSPGLKFESPLACVEKLNVIQVDDEETIVHIRK